MTPRSFPNSNIDHETAHQSGPTTSSPESADDVATYGWRAGRLFRSCRPFPWTDGEDFADARTRAGFRKHATIELGDACDSMQLKVYDRPGDSTEIPRWLGDLMISDVGYVTWVDDVSDLVDLLAHMAPTIAAMAALGDRQDRLNQEEQQRKAEACERALWSGR